MKKYFILFLALLWHLGVFAAHITLQGHPNFTYKGQPLFAVKSNETLHFVVDGISDRNYQFVVDDKTRYTDVSGKCFTSFNASNLTPNVIHKFYMSASTYVWYVVVGKVVVTQSQYSCSHTPMKIMIISDISRWERSRDGGSTWTNIDNSSVEYIEEDPTAGSAMYRTLCTDGTYSDIVTITYLDSVPSIIQALPATSTKTVDESITLEADVEDNDYSYQWKKDGKDITDATSRTYTIPTIKSSHAGDYTCYVSNGCNGVTTTTATLAVNKCAQVIDFPEIPVQTYSSGLTYSLPATTDKGLTITYQSMNTSVATVSGNTLTIKAPGTAIIAATQVGNADYLEATQVSRTLTVNKRSQVITFNELPAKTYEDLPFTLPQKTDEGLTISYTSTNTAVATVSGNTVTILKPGTTDIVASQAGDATHYPAADVSQTLVVKKAAQEITFGSLSSKTYGDAPFELNKVSNKNLTISYTSSDATIASVTDNVVTVHKPGTITITASQAGNAYYLAATPVEQTLVVKKADQSINFPALESRAYDSGDFVLTKATDKGQDITYESSNPAVATITNNVVHIEGAGTTEIFASQAGNDYYNAAPTVSQSLTITKANQTINFPEFGECVYGQTPITLNATVNSDVEIEYESSDYSVAQIDGNKLTIVGAGQCYITASAAGNKNYYTATPVERTLIVSKAQPIITFAALEEEYTYGASPIELVATSDAGQITFTSSNPSKLMIVGTKAMIQGAGKFTITASFAGNANYKSASSAQNITVNKAALTVAADNATREYGDANPDFTYKITGFVNGDTKLDLTSTIQVSSSATLTSPVGNYEIVPTATVDDNYTITCKKSVLTIEQASLTISASATREYGENNPEFNFTYSGFKNNENSSALTTLPQAYTTAKRTSPAGTYPVYVSGAEAQNYAISYEEGALIITKASLTVTVQPASCEYGEDNPKFSFTYSGFKNDESSDVLSTLPQATTTATRTTPAGTYSISASGAEAQNYTIVYVEGVLTVTKAPLTVTVQSTSREYGEDNPEFGFAYSGFKNNESSDVLSTLPQTTTTATRTSSVGTYPISASGAVAKNYSISYAEGSLTIIKAPLTISVQPTTREYGDENPEFGFSYSGFKNNENSNALSALPQATTTADKTSIVGKYPVKVSGAEAKNYAITYAEGVLTIDKAPLTIKVLDATRKQSKENPKFELSISGYKLGETIEVLDKLPTIQCEANADSPVGTYPIVLLEDGYSTNYRYILINGTLTVLDNKLIVSVTPQNASMGSVTGGGKFDEGEVIAISATPNYGYSFIQWSDGNTENPRTVTVAEDVSFEAVFAPNKYSVYVTCNTKYGKIEGTSGTFEYQTEQTYKAVPTADNYIFAKWSDGNTENPRKIKVTQDITLEAFFEYYENKNCLQVSLLKTGASGLGDMYTDDASIWSYSTKFGAVAQKEGGYTGHLYTPAYDLHNAEKVTIAFSHTHKFAGAPSNELTLWVTSDYSGWKESQWHQLTISPYASNKDWNFVSATIDVPIQYVGEYTVFAFQYKSTTTAWGTWDINSLNITAECKTSQPQPANSVKIDGLYYYLDSENKTATVTYQESMSDKNYSGLTTATIPASVYYQGKTYTVTGVGDDAFRNCASLKDVTISTSVKVLEYGAFWSCKSVESITCYSQRPPTVKNDALRGLSYNTIIYVPEEYLETYKMHDVWGLYDVRPIGAATTKTDDVIVDPAETTAQIVWPSISGIASYELVIKDKRGEVVCTLIFDANGILKQIAFGAPGRKNAQKEQVEGFTFTITGLEKASRYTYKLDAKDAQEQVIKSYSGTFFTEGYVKEVYTIKFVNWDGSLLQKLTDVEEGTTPAYTGETPTRPADKDYTYSFSGWTPEIVEAKEDATYTATYESKPITEALDDVMDNEKTIPHKVIMNNQIFILRGEKVYTIDGLLVR